MLASTAAPVYDEYELPPVNDVFEEPLEEVPIIVQGGLDEMHSEEDPFELDESLSSSLINEDALRDVYQPDNVPSPAVVDNHQVQCASPHVQHQDENDQNIQPSGKSVHVDDHDVSVHLPPPFNSLMVPVAKVQQNINSQNSFDHVIDMVCKGKHYILTGPVVFDDQIREAFKIQSCIYVDFY